MTSAQTISQEQLSQLGFHDLDEAHRQAARMDPDSFLEYILRDEETGGIITQATLHSDWQALCTKYDRLLVWSHVESGKTNQISVGRTLYELGKNPALRIAIVSNTQEQAKKIVGAISKYIEQSDEVQAVFPELKRGDGVWTQTALTVKRPTLSKDPSVQAFGVHGNILGARIDLLILDDVLDYENCRTPSMRQDLWDWYFSTLAGRLTRGARVWVVGTAFHPDDMLHRFSKHPGWHAVRYPVIDPDTGNSRWPDRWPMERIEQRKRGMPPIEFARQYLCQARDDTDAHFKKDWIDACVARGADKKFVYALPVVPPRCRVYTGVDLAVQKHNAAGETVLFTILVNPRGDREVLSIEAGKWSGPEIVQRIIDAHKRYLSICVVENNAAQDFIVQFARGAFAVPIHAHTTGRNKSHPEFGVESIAAEMAGAKWIIPSKGGLHPQTQAWITEMLYYDPQGHTGDRLMASWFAREGITKASRKVEYGNVDLLRR